MGRAKGRIRRLLALITALVTACGLFFTPAARTGLVAYAAPVWGIDVSKWQGDIDWQRVRAAGVAFAFVRIGHADAVDPYYSANLIGAHAAGIRTGAYWYSTATNVQEAMADAERMVDLMKDYPVSFPVAIDLEAEVQKSLSRETLSAIADAFCSVVYAAGYYPLVYASRNWFVSKMGPVTADKWVAQYASVNTYPGTYSVWQYSSNGRVNGINTRVDMNYLYRDYASVIIQNGFLTVGNKTFFFDNYRKKSGWINYEGGLYYCGSDFNLVTGFVDDGETVRYLDPNQGGRAVTGFVRTGDAYYFFDGPDGHILRNCICEINGVVCTFDETGRMVEPADYRPF